MSDISDLFKVKVSEDRLTAKLDCTDLYKESDAELDAATLIDYLNNHNVTYGIKENIVADIVSEAPTTTFPITIAKGQAPENGRDGSFDYCMNYDPEIKRDERENWDFREVMNIPNLQKGVKIGSLVPPQAGINGIDVNGNQILAYQGKPDRMRAGQGVIHNEEDNAFYSDVEGQLSVTNNIIKVHNTYEVNESISLKTGNLDFIGTIIIRGNVPTGYTIKAEGDIKIYGLVEAATIEAGGSVYVSEGFSGLGTGIIRAGEDVHIGYINQGQVFAGGSIYVEKSITHSHCTAEKEICCAYGNIIGGLSVAGESIEGNDIGNRMNIKTHVSIGQDNSIVDEIQKLTEERKESEALLQQLTMIGDKLAAKSTNAQEIDPKMRVMLLRQKNSQRKMAEKITQLDGAIFDLNEQLNADKVMEVIVNQTLHANVVVRMHNYKRTINDSHKQVLIALEDNEIVMKSIK